MRAPAKLFLASSNPGKLAEYRELVTPSASLLPVDLALLPDFEALPVFEENFATFAENAAGKGLHYSRLWDGLVFADDSGLVVPALGGAPGIHSARYAGAQATNSQRIEKLLREMRGKTGSERAAHFVCAIALAKRGRALAIVTDRVDGEILDAPRGSGGFGYDPVFYCSHRGKAFRRLLAALSSMI